LPISYHDNKEISMNRFQITTCAAALLALTAASGAHAQSSVKVSGLLDVGVYRDFEGTHRVGSLQRSNLAFSGVEDLGDGLQAIFRLSHRLEIDTGLPEGAGSKPFWHGESTVGLKGSFGRLRFGRALTALWDNDYQFDPWDAFDRIASPGWQFWHYNTATDRSSNNGAAEYGRLNNGVFYDSPSFGGFTLHLSGTPERSTGPGAGGGRNKGGSLNYEMSNFAAMLATETNSHGDRVNFIGARYSLGPLTLMGALDRSRFEAPQRSTARVATLGGTYVIGVTTLKASWGRLDLDGARTAFVGLGAEYALSKRTSLYASLGQQRPHGGSSMHAHGIGLAHRF
jgi:predicted porin